MPQVSRPRSRERLLAQLKSNGTKLIFIIIIIIAVCVRVCVCEPILVGLPELAIPTWRNNNLV